MADFAVLIPVGPHPADIARLRDVLASIVFYEQQLRYVVLIDDADADRRLLDQVDLPDSCTAVSLPNPRRGQGKAYLGGLATGVLHGLAWIAAHAPVDFVLKIDTDALAIGPFAAGIARVFRADERLGMVGAIGCTCDRRSERYGSDWLAPSPLAHAWRQARRGTPIPGVVSAGRRLPPDELAAFQAVSAHVEAAIEQGYFDHRYCLGGAYAIASRMARRLAQAGYLENVAAWADLPFAEDFIVSMYAYAAGMSMRDLSAEGQPFGIHWRGLAFRPDVLLARGHALIHSVKDDSLLPETSIREYFSSRRSHARPRPERAGARSEGYTLYADPATAALLRSSPAPKTLLIGAYTGLADFANVAQAQSIVRTYRRIAPAHLVVPVIGPSTATSMAAHLHAARVACAMSEIVIASLAPLPEDVVRALRLAPVDHVAHLRRLHVAGRNTALPLPGWLASLDALLERFRPSQYILSDQQVRSADAEHLLQHLGRHRPLLVGCRDDAGTRTLQRAGVAAMHAGADALDLFLDLVEEQPSPGPAACAGRPTFAFQFEPVHSIIAGEEERNPARVMQTLYAWCNDAVGALAERYDALCRPLLVSTSAETRWDTSLTLRHTTFWSTFPLATCLDMAAFGAHGRLAGALPVVRDASIDTFVGNCETTGLLFACLGVPSFTFASDAQSGALGTGSPGPRGQSFREFLTTPLDALRGAQSRFLRREQALRAAWRAALASL